MSTRRERQALEQALKLSLEESHQIEERRKKGERKIRQVI
jgi:hypothetical protein